MRSATDTGSMPREAMSATELVGRKKNDTESDVTERKRRPDTSPLAGLLSTSDPLVGGWGGRVRVRTTQSALEKRRYSTQPIDKTAPNRKTRTVCLVPSLWVSTIFKANKVAFLYYLQDKIKIRYLGGFPLFYIISLIEGNWVIWANLYIKVLFG